jgi:hypothetical protein
MRVRLTEINHIAIRVGAGRTANTDATLRAANVLNDHSLSEVPSHPLGHNSRDRVRDAAGREWHDHGDRPRGIGLRRRDPRYGRERRTGRQMQKSTTR